MSDLYKELQTFTHHGKTIPEYMHGGIVRYVEQGLPPGDFLIGIITGDLFKAAMHADETNETLLATYVAFFYNRTPAGCWGSVKKVHNWIHAKQEERDAIGRG